MTPVYSKKPVTHQVINLFGAMYYLVYSTITTGQYPFGFMAQITNSVSKLDRIQRPICTQMTRDIKVMLLEIAMCATVNQIL